MFAKVTFAANSLLSRLGLLSLLELDGPLRSHTLAHMDVLRMQQATIHPAKQSGGHSWARHH
jgi:hypothetical protein